MESIISRTGTAAALMLGALMVSGCAQSQKLVAGSSAERLSKIQAANLITAAGGAGNPCKAEDGLCPIEVTTVNVGGRDYCLATARDMNVKTKHGAGENDKLDIGWKLSVPDLDGWPVRFHASSGIVIALDADTQIEPKGKAGQSSDTPPVSTFSLKTRRNKKDAESIFLPVVIWEKKKSGKPDFELCAAVDPKIVNAE